MAIIENLILKKDLSKNFNSKNPLCCLKCCGWRIALLIIGK
jgi:hypothetical protein